MAVQIITDSASDLSPELAKELNVHLMHMRVIFEDGVYTDGVDITKAEFYEKQATCKTLPKTTQCNPQEYCDVFQALLDNGDEVISISMSSKLSGTYQSSCIAKELVDGSERLYLVDSLNVTMGEGLLVREAVRMRDAGKSAAEIVAELEVLRHKVRFVAFIGTMKYLKMGGRISATTAVVGGMLNISPIISVVEGEIKSVGQVRGKLKAMGYAEDFASHYPVDTRHCVVFGHSRCEETLEPFMERMKQSLHLQDCHHHELGALIGVHAGPGCYGMAYIGLQ